MNGGRNQARAMTTLLLALLALTVVGSVVTFFAVRHAPEGYEDETGFHAVRVARSTSSDTRATLPGNHLAGGVA